MKNICPCIKKYSSQKVTCKISKQSDKNSWLFKVSNKRTNERMNGWTVGHHFEDLDATEVEN